MKINKLLKNKYYLIKNLSTPILRGSFKNKKYFKIIVESKLFKKFSENFILKKDTNSINKLHKEKKISFEK